jgi:hypothetical protein
MVVRGSLTISMKCLGHESLRGHVQCVYRITDVPISLSLVAEAGLLENLRRLDTMIVEKSLTMACLLQYIRYVAGCIETKQQARKPQAKDDDVFYLFLQKQSRSRVPYIP